MIVYALGQALRAALAPSAWTFRRALDDPDAAQGRALRTISATLARTAYGRDLGFSARHVGDLAAYREKVPVVRFADIRARLDDERTSRAPYFFPTLAPRHERTSGSGGAQKRIPYHRPLLGSFARMFRVWVHDVLAFGPKLETGRFYFSISPRLDDGEDALGSDAEYVAWGMRALLSPFFVTVPGIAHERDPATFRRRTAAKLAGTPALEIVSVWNPSFMHVLLDEIAADPERVAATMTDPALGVRPRDRARFSSILAGAPDDWPARLWPRLRLVSCWADAHAARSAAALAARLPQATLQPKGLLATEAPISLPLFAAGDGPGQVPLVDEVFLELETDDGAIRPLTALGEGDTGRLIISQKGGLYRYRLDDRVQLTAPYRATWRLRFLGRGPGSVDLVGEKLSEDFVAPILAALAPPARLSVLVPTLGPPAHYVWLLHTRARPDADALARALDARLCEAHHFALARKLGQLGPPRVVAGLDVEERLLAAWCATGRKAGDLKQAALLSRPLDAAFFAGDAPRASTDDDGARP